MSFPRYPKYKPSSVEWLGDVPAHWEVVALKRFISMQSGEAIDAADIRDEGSVPVYGGNGVRGFTDAFTHDGDFVLVGRQGALCGNVNYASARFWASEHAVVVTPTRPTAVKWLGEMLRAMNLNQYSVSAAQPGLAVSALGPLQTALPPLPEQRAIAAFLDRETTKIDGLIAEQERLVELLKEKRQAVISYAVTKGLDPAAPMKPSGVEWLGEVPEHWEVRPLRSVGNVYGGLTGKTAEAFTDEGPSTYHFVPFTNILNNTAVRSDQLAPVQVVAGEKQNEVRAGDLLFLMSSEDYEFLGFSALVQSIPPSTYLNSFCKGFRPTTAGCCPEFLNYYCRSRVGRALISSLGFGFTRINLRTGALLSVQVLCPPLPEQRAIAAFLDRETATIDGLVNEAQSAITLLTERRSALISAAVTGQIDVRNAVPKEAA